jgi:hypothetical protein
MFIGIPGSATRLAECPVGPEAGHISSDDCPDMGGLDPFEEGGLRRVTFME